MQDQSVQAMVSDVEKDLLLAIIKNIKEQRLTKDEGRKLAQEFLALLPMRDKEDLLTKLLTFSQKHVEAKQAYIKVAKPHEEENRLKKLEMMSQHIQNGNIEHAITVAKGGTI